VTHMPLITTSYSREKGLSSGGNLPVDDLRISLKNLGKENYGKILSTSGVRPTSQNKKSGRFSTTEKWSIPGHHKKERYMKKLFLSLIFCFLFPALALATAVGTCVVTDVTSTQIASGSNRIADSNTVIVTLTCTASADDGSFPATTIPISGYYPQTYLNTYNLTGYYLYQVKRIPGNNSASVVSCTAGCPQASYTTVVPDADGFAVDLAALTTNGSATATQETLIASSTVGYPTISSALTVAITANNVHSAVITERFIFKVYKVY
jgi:hypothetical protein